MICDINGHVLRDGERHKPHAGPRARSAGARGWRRAEQRASSAGFRALPPHRLHTAREHARVRRRGQIQAPALQSDQLFRYFSSGFGSLRGRSGDAVGGDIRGGWHVALRPVLRHLDRL